MAEAKTVTWSAIGHKEFPEVGPVTVPAAGTTTLCTFDVNFVERLCVEIGVATQALDAFAIQARLHSGGSFITLFSAAGDFTSPAGILTGASGDLTTLAAGATGWFILDCLGFDQVRLTASAAANNAAVTVRAGAE